LVVAVVVDTLPLLLRTNLPHQSAALAGEGLTENLEWPEPLGRVMRAEMAAPTPRHSVVVEVVVLAVLE
jgi:hypothetical protein